MKLKYREIKDKEVWDQFVLSLDQYSFVQCWDYINVYEVLADSVYRIGIYEQDNLIGLLPIALIRAKRGSYLKLRHGPILNDTGWKDFSKIVIYLKKFAKQKGVSFVRIHPIVSESEILKKEGFRYAPTHNLDAEVTLQLNLENKTEKEIKMNMRKNTRYYIRRAFREGVKIVQDNDDFKSFYQLFTQTANRQHYTPWPKRYYEALFENFDNEKRHLFFAEVEGKKSAFGLFLDFGKYRFYKEGGMLMKYSKTYPAYAVQWAAIEDAMKKEKEIYDFWGGVSPKDKEGNIIKDYPWAGINLFKAGFGGKEVEIIHPYDLPLNWKYWMTYIFEYFEKMKRGY